MDSQDFQHIVLMCKDNKVFDVGAGKVLLPELLPGMIKENPNRETFFKWMQLRYSQHTNTFARSLRAYTFGQGNRKRIDLITKSFSLSDCYWVKDKYEDIKFESVSPYFSKFWTGESEYSGGAVPTLYVNGYLPKYWKDRNTLVKSKDIKEVYCYKLASKLGIPCAEVIPYEGRIAVKNFTNENVMLEPANCSGMIHPEDFTEFDVVEKLGHFGFKMLFLDALVANGDRHAGNFGFLRDSHTGAYLGPAPMFDFDHAFESDNLNDILIRSIKALQRPNDYYQFKGDEILNDLEGISDLEVTQYLLNRSRALRYFSK